MPAITAPLPQMHPSRFHQIEDRQQAGSYRCHFGRSFCLKLMALRLSLPSISPVENPA